MKGDARRRNVQPGGTPTTEGRRVTIRHVAELADVSLGTVSRVLNGHPHVSRDAQKAVSEAIRQLGYIPDAVAQSMRLKSSRAIGCMVSDVANPLFAKTVSAAEVVINAAGYNMILANSGDDPRRERDILSLFERRRLDGTIMTMSRDTGKEAAELLANYRLPVVLIERQVENAAIDSVASDHHQGLTQALDYLFSLNHRRIGLITVPATALPGRARLEAYKSAYKRKGIEPDKSLIANGGFSPDYGMVAAETMLSQAKPPTAIVAGANQIPGVLHAIRARGIEIPRKLSLLSLGDTDLAQLYSPPITCVRWAPEVVGRLAAETLIGRLGAASSAHRGRHFIQPVELIVRQSCGPSVT